MYLIASSVNLSVRYSPSLELSNPSSPNGAKYPLFGHPLDQSGR